MATKRKRNPTTRPARPRSSTTRRAWVIAYPAPDLPGQWLSQCLDFDVMSQGNSPTHAIAMILEAVEIVLANEITQGRNPFTFRPARPADWLKLWSLVQSGTLGSDQELERLPERNVELVATQIEITLSGKSLRLRPARAAVVAA